MSRSKWRQRVRNGDIVHEASRRRGPTESLVADKEKSPAKQPGYCWALLKPL